MEKHRWTTRTHTIIPNRYRWISMLFLRNSISNEKKEFQLPITYLYSIEFGLQQELLLTRPSPGKKDW